LLLLGPVVRLLMAICLPAVPALGSEVIPPAPAKYVNDYAGVVQPATALQLNTLLENFEKTNSSQVVVAIFPRMQSDSSIEDYTVRVAQKWGAGRKSRDNGAILFVFIQNRTIYLQAGYGLEGVLPDVVAKDITENIIKPAFKAGDYDRGLTAGVTAILQAIGGEYQGTGRTLAQGKGRGRTVNPLFILFLFLALSMIFGRKRRRGTVFGPLGRTGWGAWPAGGWSSPRGGGWSGGSSGGGFSGGGFSGGGGRFGGG